MSRAIRSHYIRRIALAAMTLIGLGPVGAWATHSQTISAAQAASGPAGNIPNGLPNHVMLGLQNHPSDLSWMTGSGVGWDVRYQYLVGDVTGSDWATWNSPRGAFASMYMQDSGSHGYTPAFSYYTMLDSGGSSGSEGDTDYAHLNSPSIMHAYFADFKTLLGDARAYGKPVIVHVEPDLWGFMEQRAGSCGQASCVSAAVASSGDPDVSGYANTLQGFAQALLHLRDTYAPNVIMAIHASCWGSGADVCNYPTSYGDTATHAAHDAAFINSAEGSGRGWDLVFVDTSDRDAGYYQSIGNPNHWWDKNNSALPNFENFRTWVSGINSGTGRRVVLWQTPLGNQYFSSMNNTYGHYQDNRAEYFLGDGPSYGHLASFAQAGVVGLLFGSGMTGQTENTDARGDGTTNPGPINTFECANCNTHQAQNGDDDGGYLRLFGGAYLSHGGIPATGSYAPAVSMAPQVSNAAPTATATPTSAPSATPTHAAAAPTWTPTRTTSTATSARTPTHVATMTPTRVASTATPTRPAPTATPTRTPTRIAPTVTPTRVVRAMARAVTVASTATPTATRTASTATATATATPSPTASPTASPTSTPASLSVSWDHTSASGSSVNRGGNEGFSATIRTNVSVSNELVDFEVYNSSGNKIWQDYQSPVSFSGGSDQTFTQSWTIPGDLPQGTYTLKMGLFTGNWSTTQSWNNSAATFTVN